MEAVRSVHADPQDAGINLIERYPWSSFAEHLRVYDGDEADATRGFSDPSCVLELFGSAKAFIAYSLSTPDGGDPAMRDLVEMEQGRGQEKTSQPKKEPVSDRPKERTSLLSRLKDKQQTLSGTSDKNTDVKRSKPEL